MGNGPAVAQRKNQTWAAVSPNKKGLSNQGSCQIRGLPINGCEAGSNDRRRPLKCPRVDGTEEAVAVLALERADTRLSWTFLQWRQIQASVETGSPGERGHGHAPRRPTLGPALGLARPSIRGAKDLMYSPLKSMDLFPFCEIVAFQMCAKGGAIEFVCNTPPHVNERASQPRVDDPEPQAVSSRARLSRLSPLPARAFLRHILRPHRVAAASDGQND